MRTKKIEMQNLRLLHEPLLGEFKSVFEDAISSSNFIGGPDIEQFEKNLSAITKSKFAVSCANGTDALEIAISSLHLPAKSVVAVPAMSWVSSASCITNCGHTPFFIDISMNDGNICLDELEAALISGRNIRCAVIVHLNGKSVDLKRLSNIKEKYKIEIIEDCAQAHLSQSNGIMVGSIGEFATYSFYPGKNLGAFGDAGAITTNYQSLAIKARKLSKHGGIVKHQHDLVGRNSRMDSLQASILNVKMPHLYNWTHKRQEIARHYQTKLANLSEFIIPVNKYSVENSFHMYPVLCERRNELREFLNHKGISTNINYPKPLDQLECFKYLRSDNMCKNAMEYSERSLCLPICPTLTEIDVNRVVSSINDFYTLRR